METANHECYLSLETAKLLKEVGFKWFINSAYRDGVLVHQKNSLCDNFNGMHYENSNRHEFFSAPTLDVAQRWMREVKRLDISIIYDPTIKSKPYIYEIYDMDEKFGDIFGIISPVTHSTTHGYFCTYEEAQEAGIRKSLEIILDEGKNNMKTIGREYYVSLEMAKLLKEAGFNRSCKYAYVITPAGDMPTGEEGMLIEYVEDVNWIVKAPTLDVAQRWLREEKDVEVNVLCVYIGDNKKYSYVVFRGKYNRETIDEGFDTYEAAQEAGIKKALEMILKNGEDKKINEGC